MSSVTSNYFCCDLGFNWNAQAVSGASITLPDGTTGSVYPLQYGLMNKTSSNPDDNDAAWFTKLPKITAAQNDVLFFVLYDITSLTDGKSSLSSPSLSFAMTLVDPDTGASATPTTPSTYTWTSSSIKFLGDNSTTVFNGTVPSYAIGPTSNAAPFGGFGQNYTFNVNGNWELGITVTVSVTANNQTTTKTFVLDPDMIVGPSTSAY